MCKAKEQVCTQTCSPTLLNEGSVRWEKNAEYSKQGYYSVEHTATNVLYKMHTCKHATIDKGLIRHKLYRLHDVTSHSCFEVFKLKQPQP